MGEVTGQSGSGATAPTAARSFTYDAAGDMLTAATSSTAAGGQPSNATGETFSYDDRGLLLTASGSAGSTAYTWNGDGQPAAAAAAKIPTYCAGGNIGALSTCMSAVYRAAGGQAGTSGVPDGRAITPPSPARP